MTVRGRLDGDPVPVETITADAVAETLALQYEVTSGGSLEVLRTDGTANCEGFGPDDTDTGAHVEPVG